MLARNAACVRVTKQYELACKAEISRVRTERDLWVRGPVASVAQTKCGHTPVRKRGGRPAKKAAAA
jgi:hypothetical protein